jgi:hypothetical protein
MTKALKKLGVKGPYLNIRATCNKPMAIILHGKNRKHFHQNQE